MTSAATHIGPYSVVRELGRGGMGVVYLATDTRLDRQVAIKGLPEPLTSDSDRLARFQREAKVLASLNHPNIGAIYGIEEANGQQYLVLEYIEGETLDERLIRGPLPIDDAIEIAIHIADALESAHEKGVIHRDLKPGNIMVTPDGTVKVLDFGLARSTATTSSMSPPTDEDSPTMIQPDRLHSPTMPGVILGTASYMSPEQARGKPVDKRTDIWAFGCVLFEMLTGRPAFSGETVTDILAAVVAKDPAWEALPAGTPAPIVRLLRRCLAKEPARRLRHIGDARLEIDEAFQTPTVDSLRGEPRLHARRWQRLVPWALTVLFAAAAGIAFWFGPRPLLFSSPARLVVVLPSEQELSLVAPGVVNPIALSPDGQLLAYAAASRGSRMPQLFLRPIGQFVDRRIEGTEGAESPFFSPNSKWIGFFAKEALWRVPVSSGAPQKICDTRELFPSASWGPDDTIVFSHYTFRLYKVSVSEGMLEPLTLPDVANGEIRHYAPQFLPGGREVLFTIAADKGPVAAILSLASNEWRVVLNNAEGARYVPSGHLVYAQSGALRAIGFDPARGETRGSPVTIADRVSHVGGLSAAHFAVSDTGTLAYLPAYAGATNATLVWVDRQGRPTPIVNDPAPYGHPRVSTDGSRIAVEVGPDIWVYDARRGTPTVLTTGGYNLEPAWVPHRDRLVFSAVRADPAAFFDLHSVAADRDTEPELLLQREGRQFPTSFTPDGEIVAFFEVTGAGEDIGILESGAASRLLPRPTHKEHSPMFSPDGRWLAYVSAESGQEEVYVTPYPGPARPRPISVNGGRGPVWSRDGLELFYRRGDQLMVVSVESSATTFTSGSPQVLFEGRYSFERGSANYDVAPDGKRFVMLQLPDATSSQINVVLNFVDELTGLVPGN